MTLAGVNALRMESNQLATSALQKTSVDVSLFSEWASAVSQDNTALADFLYQRFRPELRVAADAWLATEPRTNPDAPPSPFAMSEYRSADQEESDRLGVQAEEQLVKAQAANTRGDRYILLTVAFASVLFFAGISTKFETKYVRRALIVAGLIVLATAMGFLVTFPVAFSNTA